MGKAKTRNITDFKMSACPTHKTNCQGDRTSGTFVPWFFIVFFPPSETDIRPFTNRTHLALLAYRIANKGFSLIASVNSLMDSSRLPENNRRLHVCDIWHTHSAHKS